MKKSALFVAAILSAAVAITSCGSDKKEDAKASAPAKPAVEGITNIRWYDLDSVSNNYKLVEFLNSEAEAAMNSYQSFARQKQSEIAALEKKITDKANSGGYISQASYENDMRDYQQRAINAQNAVAQREQQIAQQAAMQQKQLIDSLDNFLSSYAKANKFELIMVKTPGAYFDPELDITDEIVAGLNARYTAPEANTETPAKK